MEVVWTKNALERANSRTEEKIAFTADLGTGIRYWSNIEDEIACIRLTPEGKEKLPPPPENRRKAVINADPGRGEVIIYEYDKIANPARIVIRGVFPFVPERIP